MNGFPGGEKTMSKTKNVGRSAWKDWSYTKMASVDVVWYREHGIHPDRIVHDSQGVEYVIGDWSWERKYPNRYESIDRKLDVNHELISAKESVQN